MRHEQAYELLPLAALGILETGEADDVAAHAAECLTCRRDRRAWAATVGRMAVLAEPVEPPPALRARVLASVAPVAGARPSRGLAVAAVLLAALSGGLALATVEARGQAQELALRLAEARAALAQASALGELAARPTVRFVSLQALAPAPGATARVLFEPSDRNAVLVVSGLSAVEPGRAYQLWVIAEGAPVPAGVFKTDGTGRAVLRLPSLDATARVKTFAVTVEPEAGSPAPTGAMVLAGSV